MLRSRNVATPLLLVVRGVVPESAPPPGLLPIAIATAAPGTRFAYRSCACTCTPAGVVVALITAPTADCVGCFTNVSVNGTFGSTVKSLLLLLTEPSVSVTCRPLSALYG